MLFLVALCFVSLFQGYQMCMDYTAMDDIDIAKMRGDWWEYQTYNTHHLMDPYDHDCLVAKFYPQGNKLTIIEDFIHRAPGMENQEHSRRQWWMSRDPGSTSGLYTGATSVAGKNIEYTYTVVGTDYENYLIAAICANDNSFQAAYVMTRSQSPERLKLKEIEKKEQATLNKFTNAISKMNAYTTKENSNCRF